MPRSRRSSLAMRPSAPRPRRGRLRSRTRRTTLSPWIVGRIDTRTSAERLGEIARERSLVIELAVNGKAHSEAVARRLDVHVARALLERRRDEEVDELHRRAVRARDRARAARLLDRGPQIDLDAVVLG